MHEKVVEEFTAKLVARVEVMKVGRGIDEGTTQGPLVNAAAVQKVKSYVEDAISKGGRLRTGGKAPADRKGFFFEPTVITGATQEMMVATDETFGPLAAIFPFTGDDEVVSMANSTELGLSGYFFSRDVGRVMRIASKLEVGMVGVNTGLISACETPFGGIKESGVGREGSKYGLGEYQNIKAVTIGNLHT